MAKPVVPTLASRSLTVDSRGRAALTVTCACSGRLALTAAGITRYATFRAGTLRVTLTAAQRRSLARHRTLAATVALTVGGTTRRLNVDAPRG